MTRRKIFTIGIIVVLLVLIIYVIVSPKGTPPPTKEASLDFQSPQIINRQGDVRLFTSETYDIVYYPTKNKYHISIIGFPFSDVRLKAEQRLLEITKVGPETACQLDVLITTPYFANPNEAGKEYDLSFCTAPSSPNLTLDSRLSPLFITQVHPAQGTVQMGKTRNSISVRFNIPPDKATVVVESNPDTKIVPKSHPITAEELILFPGLPWQSSTTYTITLKAGLRSRDGKYQLKENVVLRYSIVEAKFIDAPDSGI